MSEFKDTSGMLPLEFNVVVRVEDVKDKIGNIYIPEETADNETAAATRGIYCVGSATAFTYEHGAERPDPGDEVLFKRFDGVKVKRPDGNTYFVIKDKSLQCILTDSAAAEDVAERAA